MSKTLRTLTASGFTTKGSRLTNAEMDQTLIDLYNEILALDVSGIQFPYAFSKTLNSEDILALNSSPQILIEGADGYMIRILNYSLKAEQSGESMTAYASNLNLQLITEGADFPQAENDKILASTTPKTIIGHLSNPAFTGDDVQLLSGVDVLIQTETGDPVTGDFNVIITGAYELIPV